jgi:DNA-binding transcriptional regulator LsrR (DeoR family)
MVMTTTTEKLLVRRWRVAELLAAGRSPSEIAAELGISVHTVYRDREWCLGREMFRVVLPNLAAASTDRDNELEQWFHQAYRLPQTVVVAPRLPGSARRGGVAGPPGQPEGVRLSARLGLTAGSHLARERISAMNRIALGAGRAVHDTAKTLARLLPVIRRTGIEVYSLHGCAQIRVWRGRDAGRPYDVVGVCNSFSELVPAAALFPLSEPLLQENAEAVRRTIDEKAGWLRRSDWEELAVDHAIVGVGVMGEAHNLTRKEEREVRPIRTALRRLRWLCSSFDSRHGFHPVSDIADCLFYVADPEEDLETWKSAVPLIETINRHRLGIETGLYPVEGALPDRAAPPCREIGSLLSVEHLVVVAGGPAKERAIDRLVRTRRPDGRPYIDTLITDARTARSLQKLWSARRERPAEPFSRPAPIHPSL